MSTNILLYVKLEIKEVEFEIDARSDALDIFIQQSYIVNQSYLINREAECVTTGGMIDLVA